MHWITDTIQIAGITDAAEARMLVECGVDLLGFPFRLAVHEEDLSEPEAAEIIRSLDLPARAVLITYLSTALEILELCGNLGVSVVQLHGDVRREELRKLSDRDPSLRVIKGLTVRAGNLAELEAAVRDAAPFVDAFITDSYDPATGACGATGKTHDWRISRAIVESSPRPVILAGGLDSGNVGRAILQVKPAGVDAHTGVEDENGRKKRAFVEAFVTAAGRAFASL